MSRATNESDDVKFTKFKLLLAQATSDLLDKLAIDPPDHLTSSEDHNREKRAAKKKGKKGKGKRWFRVLVEAGW
uniref:SRI domain-containing protein n=1 Tax=Panagrellus redivivus TaxID=6233 RepID=A0A7E4ZSN0_PANRE